LSRRCEWDFVFKKRKKRQKREGGEWKKSEKRREEAEEWKERGTQSQGRAGPGR
jgi:hypothetical protein